METKKTLGIILGVLAFIAFILGVTYAWLSWGSTSSISGNSGCFTIDYSGTGFEGTLEMSDVYSKGITSSVTMKINSSCTNINGTGTIYLNTKSFNGPSSWTTDGALKYTVVTSGSVVASGKITSASDLAIYSNFNLASSTASAVTYTIYIWLDGTIAGANYANAKYVGNIHATAKQIVS